MANWNIEYPDIVGGAIDTYHKSVNDYQKAQENLMKIREARNVLANQKENFDIAKKKSKLELQSLGLNNQLTQAELQEKKQSIDLQNKLQDQYFKGVDAATIMGEANAKKTAEGSLSEGLVAQTVLGEAKNRGWLEGLEPEIVNGKISLKRTPKISPAQQQSYDLQKERIDLAKQKIEKGLEYSPSLKKEQYKSADSFVENYQKYEFGKATIKSAIDSVNKVPKGILGKLSVGYLKQFDPNNPILGDWQNIKSILGDAQLLQVAKTKGAISNAEMQTFLTMVANDDLNSLPRITASLSRLEKFLENEKTISEKQYEVNFGKKELERVKSILGENKKSYTPQQQAILEQLSPEEQEEYRQLRGI